MKLVASFKIQLLLSPVIYIIGDIFEFLDYTTMFLDEYHWKLLYLHAIAYNPLIHAALPETRNQNEAHTQVKQTNKAHFWGVGVGVNPS